MTRTRKHRADSHVPPTGSETGFPIVALGASAGGLEALKTFFSEMPPDAGIAFVVVTHQHAGHLSLMADLLGRQTDMPVIEVSKQTKIEPGHVYTSKPGRNLGILHGELHSLKPDEQATLRLPVDYFFRSLALDQKHLAIGIVLSGTGTDGTLGVKEIKGSLGMVMVQAEEDAQYDGMPRSSIATGLVDYVLPVSEMPKQLLAYCARLRVPLQPTLHAPQPVAASEALQRIFVLLRSRTGHDFSLYKDTTTRRRIERRMNVHHLDTAEKYLDLLQTHPGEAEHLFKELLIGVTSFFRDPEAFDALALVLSDLVAKKPEGYVLRVWVAGCSTGEEAYSIAILVKEIMEKLKKSLSIQIFATDLDKTAIDVARAGVYPLGIANDLTPERLARFFAQDDETYRVSQEIREMVVFAQQNVIADPPFTKLDLLSCRNLLIYLGSELQARLLPLFHYALKPNGILFLGPSESIGAFTPLFGALDKKCKIFEQREAATLGYVAHFPTAAPDLGFAGIPQKAGLPAGEPPNLAPLAEKLLVRALVPPAALVHERGDLVHIHGRTGRFLEPAPGLPTRANIFNMAREGLQLDLSTAIRQAAAGEIEVVHPGVRIDSNGAPLEVDLRVQRVSEPSALRGLFLVSFENARAPEEYHEAPDKKAPAHRRDRIAMLERELQHAKESHQSTIEELETANEELKSTNEELQSTNEELQSTNEELETSKEEMQSLNEELQTVNAELQDKVEELSQTNDDMRNLLNATDIATIFLDNDLHIKRYTEQATHIIRLIASDIGRPIGDLASKLNYDPLVQDAADVMRSLVFKEAEVQSDGGQWYLMRILPYRTADNIIDGLVLTFVDISATKALQDNERLLLETLQRSPVMVFRQDLDMRFTWACSQVFGRAPRELLGKTDAELFGAQEAASIIAVKRGVLQTGTATRQRASLLLNGQKRIFDLFVEPTLSAKEELTGISCIVTDVTGLAEARTDSQRLDA